MKKLLFVLTMISGMMLVLLPNSHAVIISVPIDQPTVQAGVDAALTGDTVLIAPGTYEESVVIASKAVVIASDFIFTGDTDDIDSTRLEWVHFGQCPDQSELRGLTLIGNAVTFRSQVRLADCQLGHIECTRSDLTISGCEIVGGWADYGGGLSAYNSRVTIDKSLFFDNVSIGDMVWCGTSPYGWDYYCHVGGRGGAIYGSSSSFRISSSTFVNNHASDVGGDDDFWFQSRGGAILATDYDSDTLLLQIEDCVFYGNYSEIGGPVYLDGVDITITNCDVYGNASGDWVGSLTGMNGADGNLSYDPLFCDAEFGNFHIAAHSSCAPENSPSGTLVGAYDVGCSCFNGTGNADCDPADEIDIGDMTALIKYLLVPGFEELACFDEANIDGEGTVDVADLTALISYLFIPPFTEPSPCQ